MLGRLVSSWIRHYLRDFDGLGISRGMSECMSESFKMGPVMEPTRNKLGSAVLERTTYYRLKWRIFVNGLGSVDEQRV